MTKYLYSGQFMMRRIGRRSPNSFTQIKSHMSVPDGVLVGKDQPRPGWTLASWKKIAEALPDAGDRGRPQREKLRDDILAVIEELAVEEKDIAKETAASYRRRRK